MSINVLCTYIFYWYFEVFSLKWLVISIEMANKLYVLSFGEFSIDFQINGHISRTPSFIIIMWRTMCVLWQLTDSPIVISGHNVRILSVERWLLFTHACILYKQNILLLLILVLYVCVWVCFLLFICFTSVVQCENAQFSSLNSTHLMIGESKLNVWLWLLKCVSFWMLDFKQVI